MLDLIKNHHAEISELCQRYRVKRLELFGSAAQGEFNPASSDLDFFIEFLDYASPTIADQWFAMQEGLEKILGHPVDLTSPRTTTNPYFLQVANQHKMTLYAA